MVKDIYQPLALFAGMVGLAIGMCTMHIPALLYLPVKHGDPVFYSGAMCLLVVPTPVDKKSVGPRNSGGHIDLIIKSYVWTAFLPSTYEVLSYAPLIGITHTSNNIEMR